MAQLEKVRLPNGNVVVPGDWGGGTRSLWSRVDIGPGPIGPLVALIMKPLRQFQKSIAKRRALNKLADKTRRRARRRRK